MNCGHTWGEPSKHREQLPRYDRGTVLLPREAASGVIVVSICGKHNEASRNLIRLIRAGLDAKRKRFAHVLTRTKVRNDYRQSAGEAERKVRTKAAIEAFSGMNRNR